MRLNNILKAVPKNSKIDSVLIHPSLALLFYLFPLFIVDSKLFSALENPFMTCTAVLNSIAWYTPSAFVLRRLSIAIGLDVRRAASGC